MGQAEYDGIRRMGSTSTDAVYVAAFVSEEDAAKWADFMAKVDPVVLYTQAVVGKIAGTEGVPYIRAELAMRRVFPPQAIEGIVSHCGGIFLVMGFRFTAQRSEGRYANVI